MEKGHGFFLLFQSTRSARSATAGITLSGAGVLDFNPRAPRGARPLEDKSIQQIHKISIHALREERDAAPALHTKADKISIHALREERDKGCGGF